MLNNNMLLESQTGKTTIKGHKMPIVKQLVKFIYTGKVDKIDENNAEDLLRAADQFLLSGMKEICEVFLMSKVNLDNAIEMLSLGHTYEAVGLKKKAKDIIVEEG